jgi:hypothetical protein
MKIQYTSILYLNDLIEQNLAQKKVRSCLKNIGNNYFLFSNSHLKIPATTLDYIMYKNHEQSMFLSFF